MLANTSIIGINHLPAMPAGLAFTFGIGDPKNHGGHQNTIHQKLKKKSHGVPPDIASISWVAAIRLQQ
ncbi:MAG: hypothetical protein A3D44_04050 [Candidatus Staskawiczbacteria bacterium RIFCSPHIGHO2_02_FULL_42_22]|uniref:Uncharacterized protein n=1 Tax=Candidatus Staskawiczbacteria bacterium RIFCSPHIGHO2_02_FULL_42_22 TaxID=1802207 RepID=A0A1G2I3L6_9BACT|nr:MAG: hypothetical protein A3D44_04050 [Candidatus Staskawiczbacteria bacterium RIFCSPHIGHO2_02_FULL_42_22]